MTAEQQPGGNMVQLCGVLSVEGHGAVGNGSMQEGHWVDGPGDNPSVGYYIERVLTPCSISLVPHTIPPGYPGASSPAVSSTQLPPWIRTG